MKVTVVFNNLNGRERGERIRYMSSSGSSPPYQSSSQIYTKYYQIVVNSSIVCRSYHITCIPTLQHPSRTANPSFSIPHQLNFQNGLHSTPQPMASLPIPHPATIADNPPKYPTPLNHLNSLKCNQEPTPPHIRSSRPATSL